MRILFGAPAAAPGLQEFRLIHGEREYRVLGRFIDDAQFLKANEGAGGRWITVHPNGKDEKGVPVLIQETTHGSGVYHVVGGAGGKLNYLKLRGVKSKESYASDVRDRQKGKREEQKAKVKAEKEAGTHESRQATRAKIKAERVKAEQAFIKTVAEKSGWDAKQLELPADQVGKLSEKAQKRVHEKHHGKLLKQALAAEKQARARLVLDADQRHQELLNEPEQDPDKPKLGYAPKFGERTESPGDIKAEAQALDTARRTPEEREMTAKAQASSKAIRDEVARADVPMADLKAKVSDTAQAAEIMKAAKQLKAVQRKAKAALKSVDAGEEKAYVLEVGDEPTDADIQKDVDSDLRTLRTRAFLGEVGKVGNGEALGGHVGAGAYNALNGVALTIAGHGLLERDAVDVLGIAGAAQALAHRLRTDMSPEQFQQATDALQQYHVDHYMQRSEEALREAAELHDTLDELKLPPAADGNEIAAAHEINQRRQQAVATLRRSLGQALGEMEAHAALLVAMKGGATDNVKVPLGDLKTEDAVRRLRAIGLNRGDYALEHAGAEVIATVTPAGLDRMTPKVDPEHGRAVQDSLDIINGKADDDNFWPQGVAKRPDLALPDAPAGVAPGLSEPFQPGADLHQSIKDYIGGRMADGHAIGDIVGDLQSEDISRLAGDRRAEYFDALNKVVPLAGADGKSIEHEDRRAGFEQMADEFVGKKHGGSFAPIHSQHFPVDETSTEALHRAFSAHPEGPLAFKAVGELEAQDQHALRKYFGENIAAKDEATAGLKQQLEAHAGAEPEREVEDMFGRGTNPAWQEWKARGDDLRGKIDAAGLDWPKYVRLMGGPTDAYAAVQDHVRGRVAKEFADAHNKLRPDAPLKLGRTVLRNHLRHLDAVDPAAREQRLAAHRELVDSMRERTAGRYAAGSVADKVEAQRERQAALEQSQLGFFATQSGNDPTQSGSERPLAADERHTLGAAAENQLARMAGTVGQNFKPGEPVQMWQPSMSGKFVNQQRAIKLIERNKRLALAQGVGSGKTSMGLGAFAHLQSQGKVKRGMFLVPSIVQGQFGAEALKMLEPGKFKWHAHPGAGREERLAAYKDPATHFSVVTHQAFRDDMVHLGAQQAGIDEKAMAAKLDTMPEAERKAWAKQTMAGAGMDHDFMMVDEGHDLLNRAGKQNSQLANVVDAVSSNTPYYVSASADPAKNDTSEIFDMFHKMDPARYGDRDAFMRRYGVDTAASKDQLRREMARYFYPGRIDPGVKVHAREVPVTLSGAQQQALADVDEHVGRMRLARLENRPDIESAKALSPESFEGQPETGHDAIAHRLQGSIGVLKDTAHRRIIDAAPDNAKTETLSKLAMERKGKPGVVFARSRAAVAQIAERLKKEGHRVVTITGADSAQDKMAKRLKFRPETGDPEADVLVASDAGAVGMNAQRGAWLAQYDTPMAQPLDAKVLTPTGWQLMGNIQLGDMVIAGDGTPTEVIGVYPKGEKEIFRVTAMDGRMTECCAEHLWLTTSRYDRSQWRVRQLGDMLNNIQLKDGGSGKRRANYMIPLVGIVQFEAQPIPMDGYLMGLLLGDGEFGERHVALAAVEPEIIDAAKVLCAGLNTIVSKVGDRQHRLIGNGTMSASYPTKRESPVLHMIRALGLAKKKAWHKFVPAQFLFNSAQVRLATLQGLMDSDGTVDKRTGHISFCSTSQQLLEDVAFLVRSLGGTASVGSSRRNGYTYRGEKRTGRPSWKATLSMPAGVLPFRLARKLEYCRPRTQRPIGSLAITEVTPAGRKQTQCIAVAHPAHLYVTDGFMVTHNTAKVHAQRNGRIHRLGQMNPDIELMDLVADHPSEREARARLKRKYELRDILTSPLEGLDDTGFAPYLKRASEARRQASAA